MFKNWKKNDRLRTLASALLGTSLILLSGLLPGTLTLISWPLIYLFIPAFLTWDREVRILTRKVLNADGKNIIRLVHEYIKLEFIVMLIIVVLLPKIAKGWWSTTGISFEDIYPGFRDLALVSLPYLTFHIYLFIRNMPYRLFTELFSICFPSSSTKYNHTQNPEWSTQSFPNNHSSNSSSRFQDQSSFQPVNVNNDYYYHPSYRNCAGNIFHDKN